ncbi:hypothetical protein CMO88_03110 [Candidatus Woesearchaeota archaeon]|nr:hypothetical protein [Candidatus Woesearchaeota archaeon]|tara:strand:+ start:22044 stop:22595 length:552 start_codon:yes stop_codon:yes gene_type:complete
MSKKIFDYRYFVTGVIVIALLGAPILVKPVISAYTAYNVEPDTQINKTDLLNLQLSIINSSLVLCSDTNDKLLAELEDNHEQLVTCVGERSSYETNLSMQVSEYEKEINALSSVVTNMEGEIVDLEVKDEELNDLKVRYAMVVENSAHNICCKQRIDKPSISSYDVQDNKIVCLEEGTLKLVC